MTNKKLLSAEPQWIEFDGAVELHDAILSIHGGLPGFPQPAYLDSALNAPRQHYHYNNDGGCDLFDLAAVYLYHIAKGHAFIDGNKRTAYLTTLVFLNLNGVDVMLPKNFVVLAQATVNAAKSLLDKPALAEIMRRMPRRRTTPGPGRKPRIVRKRGRPHGKKKRPGKRRTRKPFF